jgi:hypothetical protein
MAEFMEKEVAWLAANRARLEKEYPGKWVAVHGSELVAIGDSPSEVVSAAQARGIDDPLIDVMRSRRAQESVIIRALYL